MQEHKYKQVYVLWTREVQGLVAAGMLLTGASRALLLSAAAESSSGCWWAPRRVQNPQPLSVGKAEPLELCCQQGGDWFRAGKGSIELLLSTTCTSLGNAFTTHFWLKQVETRPGCIPSARSKTAAQQLSSSLGLVCGSQLFLCSTEPPAQKLLWCPWLKLKRLLSDQGFWPGPHQSVTVLSLHTHHDGQFLGFKGKLVWHWVVYFINHLNHCSTA